MKTTIITFFLLLTTIKVHSCDNFSYSQDVSAELLMGKKSKFYDAYKQGKCVLEDALKTLPVEQRKVIANLIAKTYKLETN
ncbi:MAG: hypothetical protein CMP36_03160 [Rickettsiales bacterium]|nr:hypothetical protein [Rickettsiales bacterium]OUV79152.1 MAG: hypothetical protein CBC91_03915 [Rickettsiales bacterium TMED131]